MPAGWRSRATPCWNFADDAMQRVRTTEQHRRSRCSAMQSSAALRCEAARTRLGRPTLSSFRSGGSERYGEVFFFFWGGVGNIATSRLNLIQEAKIFDFGFKNCPKMVIFGHFWPKMAKIAQAVAWFFEAFKPRKISLPLAQNLSKIAQILSNFCSKFEQF